MTARIYDFPDGKVCRACRGHMPFIGHRNQAEVAQDKVRRQILRELGRDKRGARG